MNPHNSGLAYAIAIIGGALLWLITMALSGRTEAWDSSLYWSMAYPLSILLAGGLGYYFPHRTWRWGLTVMLIQAVVLMMTTSGYSLLPLGLILFGILSLPAIWLARIAARLRERKGI